ncbi:MAG: nucleotidyltransferase family protein [Candidatus Roseilinea sp.]|uniref:nucleotidyltransferase family protein n=1 Tax=Candidatus Roseilinea sp. TaxID=2838777 RepID=UPI00404B5643
MPVEIPADKMADYREMARRRHEQEQARLQAALQARETLAWQLARRAAQLLRESFGVSRVVVFGSLVQPGMFSLYSDVDPAAWGIQPEDTFRAIGAVYNLSSEIDLNLVDVAVARSSVYHTILAQGVDL